MTPPAQAKIWKLASLKEGQAASVAFTVTDDDMAKFASLSGDHNPLHCNTDYARSNGFEGRVVFGALLLAKVSQLIGMELPGRDSLWIGIDMQFASPLYVGRPATVEASASQVSAATQTVELKLRIQSEGRLIGRGKALVRMRDGG